MSEIKPALTAEEWAACLPDITAQEGIGAFCTGEFVQNVERHAFAALCLHEQPFGFTRWDVRRHREQAGYRRRLMVEDPLYANAHEEYADWHDSMADRIEALIPPEEHDGQ